MRSALIGTMVSALVAFFTLSCGGGGGGSSSSGNNPGPAPPAIAKYAYATSVSTDEIFQYSINNSGILAQTGSITHGDGPVSIAVDAPGKYLYVANKTGNNVSQYVISSGLLTNKADFPSGNGPTCIAVDPSGRYSYVTAGNNVSQYTITSGTGQLAPNDLSAAVLNYPVSITFDPAGKYAYVVNNQPGPGSVQQFTIQSTGKLTATAVVTTGTLPQSMVVTPSGKYAYVASQDGNISKYSISDLTGGLTGPGNLLMGTCGEDPCKPISITVDPSGKYVYVANANNTKANSGKMAQFKIGVDGSLTAIGPGLIDISDSADPSSVRVDPTGKYVYVTVKESEKIRYISTRLTKPVAL